MCTRTPLHTCTQTRGCACTRTHAPHGHGPVVHLPSESSHGGCRRPALGAAGDAASCETEHVSPGLPASAGGRSPFSANRPGARRVLTPRAGRGSYRKLQALEATPGRGAGSGCRARRRRPAAACRVGPAGVFQAKPPKPSPGCVRSRRVSRPAGLSAPGSHSRGRVSAGLVAVAVQPKCANGDTSSVSVLAGPGTCASD